MRFLYVSYLEFRYYIYKISICCLFMSHVKLISIQKGISYVVLLSKRYKEVIFMRLATPRVLLKAFLG